MREGKVRGNRKGDGSDVRGDLYVVCQLRCWLCLGEKLAWRQAYPGHSSAVNKTLVFHFSPPNAGGTQERKWTSEGTGDDSNLSRLTDPDFGILIDAMEMAGIHFSSWLCA